MTRHLLILSLLATLIILVIHFDLLPRIDSASDIQAAQASQREITLFIHDLERRHFDVNGQPSSQILTDKAIQYSDDKEHLFLSNATFFFGNNAEQWQGKAKNAKIHLDDEISLLSDDVLFFQLDSNTKIKTNTLTINNISKVAISDDLVTIYDDLSKTTATGMEANLQTQHIWLQNNVHSVRKPVIDHTSP